MKIILSTISTNLDSGIDPRFGRSAYLMVVDTDTLQVEAHTNPGLNAQGGAGVQAAQFAADQKVKAVISGDFGPNAFDALNAAGISMYLYGNSCTARQAVEYYQAGQLRCVTTPTQSGHHS
jgi:predicted Fe-Mo cluster-binding NifX family protein